MAHHRSGLSLDQRLYLHDLVHTDSIERGIRCDTEWCNAFHDHRLMCGDHRGPYAGMVHRNRAERAEARDAHQPYEHGRVFPDPEFD